MHSKAKDALQKYPIRKVRALACIGLHVMSGLFSQVETRGELSVHAFGDDSTCVTEGDG